MPAEQRRQPVAVGVAPDADEARRDVVDLARAPVLKLGQAAARAVLQVQLERARVQRLRPREVRPARSYSCTRNSLRCAADDQRARVLGDARRRRSRRRSRTGPRRRRPSGTCRKAPPVQNAAFAASSLWRSIVRRLEYQRSTSSRCSRKASSSEHRITPRSASAGSSSTWTTDAGALHEPPGVRAVGQRARDDLGHAAAAPAAIESRRARGLERVEVEVLQARRPEARAPPHRQLRGLVAAQRGLAQLRQRAPVARAGAGQRVVEGRLAVAPGLTCTGVAPFVASRRRAQPAGAELLADLVVALALEALDQLDAALAARSARPSGCARTGA